MRNYEHVADGGLFIKVAGRPKPQPRPRAVKFKKKAMVYDPGTAGDWREAVRHEAVRQRGETRFLGLVDVWIGFYLPRPKSKRRKNQHREDGEIYTEKGGDIDNLAKVTLDALTDAGVWEDDAQVCRLVLERRYHADKGGAPGCLISIAPVTELD